MYPELFHIENHPIYAYGFCIMLGIIAAFIYLNFQKNKINLSINEIGLLLIITIISCIIGGKLFLYIGSWDYYISHKNEMFEWSGKGFVFYGSSFMSIASWWLFAKLKKINFTQLLDVTSIGVAMVHGMGKIGCLLAGCCYGKICNNTFGIIYNNEKSAAFPLYTPLYPVQIFDSIIIFFILIILLYLAKHKQFKGQLTLTYMLIYGTGRFFTEYLRGDDDRGFLFNNTLSQGQFISIILVLIALSIYVFKLRNLRKKYESY